MHTDEYILKLLKRDPDKGAKILVKQYSSLLGSICARRLQNPEDINECVNDTFAEFLLNLEKYSCSKGSIKKYLCTIAEHKAVDLFRKNCHRAELERDLLAKQKEAHLSQVVRTREIEQLDEAMEKLPPLDQQILKMHYYDNLSYKEISEELDMSYEKVRKRGLRGKKKLLHLLLLALLILGITACATIVMKQQGLLPKWFPFYEIIPGKPPLDTASGVEDRFPDVPSLRTTLNTSKSDTSNQESDDSDTMSNSSAEDDSGRKYYFSDRRGILDPDKPAYRLSKSSQAIEKNGIRYEIKDAFYYDGLLEISMISTLIDMSRLNTIEEPDFYDKEEMIDILQNASNWTDDDRNDTQNWYILSSDGEKIRLIEKQRAERLNEEYPAILYTLPFVWSPKTTTDTIELTFFFSNGLSFDLTLTQQEAREYVASSDVLATETPEYSEAEKTEENTVQVLPDSSSVVTLRTGIASVSGNTAIVELYQDNIEEYTISDWITLHPLDFKSTFYGAPTLIDKDGNRIKRSFITTKTVQTETGNSKKFEIYFHNIEAGEYTLELPGLYLQKDQKTDIIEIPLPTGEEDSMECDISLLFPDGSGMHITGIERMEYTNISYNISANGVIAIEEPYLKYRPVFDLIPSSNGLQLACAFTTVTTSNQLPASTAISRWDTNASEVSYYFEVQSDEMPDSLNVQLYNPSYLLDETISFDITVQEY